jgi:ankyrin repeat protein
MNFMANHQEHLEYTEGNSMLNEISPLTYASGCRYSEGSLKLVKYILQALSQWVRGDQLVSFVTANVLIAAAAAQNDIVIKYLHGICGRVDCRNALGITPLHAAARFGRRTTCDLLLGLGAQMPTHFPSPLDLACFHGHVDVISFLIEKGALTCATPRKTHTDTSDSLQGHINIKRFGFSYRDSEAHMRNWRESPLKGLIDSGY